MPSEDSTLRNLARTAMSDEYSDYLLYQRLSTTVDAGSPFADALKVLSSTEYKHYEFWKKYVPDEQPKVAKVKVFLVLFLRRLFGLTFASRYLDRHETNVISKYKSLANLIPGEDRAAFQEMVVDEEDHEKAFSQKIETSAIQYISFVVLGLADALVEITGIHAGSLGIYNKTEIAGLAGVVAGGSASLAMAYAAFAQAKQGFKGSARLSATYTGVSYFVTAIILAAPYFLTSNMVYALSASLLLAVLILGMTTYYSTVILEKPFARDFLGSLAFMFSVTIILFVAGYLVRITTGIQV